MDTTPSYADRFETIKMQRRDGILELVFHTDGGPLRWGAPAIIDMSHAFAAIASDPENRVVILTGTGDEFNGPKGSPETFPKATARGWDAAHWNTRHLLGNLLDIEALVIAALNGPVWRHAETPLLSDIVLASDTTVISDSGHFVNGLVPGDGMNIVMPLLMGFNRARYFMLMGQELDAPTLKELGLVSEVLPQDEVLPRAWEIASQLVRQSPLVVRYTRVSFVHTVRQMLLANQGYGVLLEGMACIDDSLSRSGYTLGEREGA